MAKHAFLSASASHRWINCPPSAKLCEGIKDEPSPHAQEGTDCHELCAYLVEKALGRDVEDPTENLTYYSAMSSLLGKKKFEQLLDGLVYKPPGKPALVPESDKRPAMNTAADDFNDN